MKLARALQEARDAALRNEAKTGETTNQLNDSNKLRILYGYDAVEEAKNHLGAKLAIEYDLPSIYLIA